MLLDQWRSKWQANVYKLRALLCKLVHTAQCCPPDKFFINWILATLRDFPLIGQVQLIQEFQTDVQWFSVYFPHTKCMYMIAQDNGAFVHLLVNAYTTGCGALCHPEAYHAVFPTAVMAEQHPICHLEALNT